MSSDPFASYRSQITAIDLSHLALIMITIVIMITLSALADILNKPILLWYIPLLTITMLGLIARLETMVHRLGGFLKAQGDPWEAAKSKHVATRFLMPIADILCMGVVIPLLVNAEYRIFTDCCLTSEYTTYESRLGYLVLTLSGNVFGVFGWIFAAVEAKKGFTQGS